jgi:hypothetical protein
MQSGWAVMLVALASGELRGEAVEPIGRGALEVIRISHLSYEKQKAAERLVWTVLSNVLLLKAAFKGRAYYANLTKACAA